MLAATLQPDASSSEKLGGALLNAIIFICVIVGMTLLLVLLFKYEVCWGGSIRLVMDCSASGQHLQLLAACCVKTPAAWLDHRPLCVAPLESLSSISP